MNDTTIAHVKIETVEGLVVEFDGPIRIVRQDIFPSRSVDEESITPCRWRFDGDAEAPGYNKSGSGKMYIREYKT